MQDPSDERHPPSLPLDTILSWPNTPPPHIINSLQSLISQTLTDINQGQDPISTPPALADHLKAYTERLSVHIFREEATAYYKQVREEYPDLSPLTAMRNAARTGSSPDTIGMGLMTDDPAVPLAPPAPGLTTVIFTRLARHPQWMGLDSLLPYVRNLQAIVFQDPDSSIPIPDTLIVTPRAVAIEGDHTTSFPKGPPSDLDQMLAWHGASPRLWVVL